MGLTLSFTMYIHYNKLQDITPPLLFIDFFNVRANHGIQRSWESGLRNQILLFTLCILDILFLVFPHVSLF